MFRHLANRRLCSGGARLVQAAWALLVRRKTVLAAVMLGMSGLGLSLCHQIFTSVCPGRELWEMCYFSPQSLGPRLWLEDTFGGLLVFFLFFLSSNLAHHWISTEEPTVEFHL